MKLIASTLFALSTLAIPLSKSYAAQPPTCPTAAGMKTVHRMSELPESIRRVLKEKVGDIVDSNQPFDDVDVVRYGGHFDRFAFAWAKGPDWVIVTEHGGIAYSNPVYLLKSEAGAATAGLVTSKRSYREPVCIVAGQLLINANRKSKRNNP